MMELMSRDACDQTKSNTQMIASKCGWDGVITCIHVININGTRANIIHTTMWVATDTTTHGTECNHVSVIRWHRHQSRLMVIIDMLNQSNQDNTFIARA